MNLFLIKLKTTGSHNEEDKLINKYNTFSKKLKSLWKSLLNDNNEKKVVNYCNIMEINQEEKKQK
jgi:hypothetical protein